VIPRLPVLGAIIAGVTVLGLSLGALLTRVPPTLEQGNGLEMSVRTVQAAEPLIDPGFLTAIIVVLALAGLTVLFFVEFLKPKAARKASSRRLRAVEEVLSDIDGGR